MKSFKEFMLTESQITFTSQMNKRTFSPTNAQLKQLIDATKAVTGKDKLSALSLDNVNIHSGTATFTKDKKKYSAFKLRSNESWYLSGEYEMV